MKHLAQGVVLSVAAVLASPAAAGFVVDGNIDEWLSDKATWAVASPAIHATVEDQTGALGVRLMPGYGGQAYDAEALFATISGSRLYVALATGHNPATKTAGSAYGAGDFAFDFGKNGSYDVGINYRQASGSASDTFGVLGGVYRVSAWNYGLWDTRGNLNPAQADPAHPTSIKSGALLGRADFAFSTTPKKGYGAYTGDGHYFYEMSVDLGVLRSAGWDGLPFNIHWTENCANDAILVDPGAQAVPEPGALALLGLGLTGLVGVRRRASKA